MDNEKTYYLSMSILQEAEGRKDFNQSCAQGVCFHLCREMRRRKVRQERTHFSRDNVIAPPQFKYHQITASHLKVFIL